MDLLAFPAALVAGGFLDPLLINSVAGWNYCRVPQQWKEGVKNLVLSFETAG